MRGTQWARMSVAAALIGLIVAVAGAVPAAAGGALKPPVGVGTLRITGTLRDGSVVTATGLHWKLPALPAGDRVLTFEVAYVWRSCSPVTHICRPAADTAPTTFAAQRYTVGHADSGRLLKLLETARVTVETDPATFSFTVLHTERSVLSQAPVAAFPAGQAPRSAFLDGTPEQRTGSRSELFRISPPHYNAADGQPVIRFRMDNGGWRDLPADRVISTGLLGLGQHTLIVRTANSAGVNLRTFSWTVAPLPAPVACVPRPHQACWYPPHLDSQSHPMSWDWQIGRVTPLQRTGSKAVDMYDIDGFLTTTAEITALHTSWAAATLPHPKAACYLDLAWEDYRPDGSPPSRGGRFPASTLGTIYFGYPQERWLDVRQLNALKPMINARVAMCAAKGFDAVELDDIDSFDPPSTTGFELTRGDWQNFLAYADNQIHRDGMTVLWKNSGLLSWWGRQYSDGAVVEECYVYRQCFSSQLAGSTQYGFTCTSLSGSHPCGWDDFTTDTTAQQPNGKWVGEVEYAEDGYVCAPGVSCAGRRSFVTYCASIGRPVYGFAGMRMDVNLDGRLFQPCPAE